MAAKLLFSSADDNPDLQKQIGCMTGIFQLFDRHHIVTPRHISHKRLPTGNSHFNHDNLERESNGIRHRQTGPDISLNKGVSEKQRVSTESSRVSFSSYGSSSMSSLDFKAQADAPFDQVNFPETPMRDTVMNQRSTSPHLGRQPLDLRDVVKDSMYREARRLSVRTTAKEEAAIRVMKHRDSPRPLLLSKSDGYARVGKDGKQSAPIDVNESLRVLSKLREAPWHYGEAREPPRLSSYEVKDGGHWHSISKDAPQFSYDGREISRLSFETRETIKCQPKLQELPRLSLDSRQGSWSTYNPDSQKHNHFSRNFSTGNSTSDGRVSSLQQSSAMQSRPPSVVAKLMGLETLTESYLANDTQSSLSETGSTQGNGQFSRSLEDGFIRPLQISNSPKSSLKDLNSPRWKNPDVVVKPISSSRFPIEHAPWKQQDGNRSSKKPNSKALKAPAKTPDSFPSVYSEIEKRLKDLEFKQSGRDLRALKQILEAMQVKGLLETRKEEQASNVVGSQRDYEPKPLSLIQNSRSTRKQNSHGNKLVFSTIRGTDSARTFESPIVIMKPVKLIEKTGTSASSVIPIMGLTDHSLQSGCGAHADNKKGTTSGRIAKDQSPKNTRRDVSTSSSDKKGTSSSKTTKSTQSKPRSQQFLSSVKNSGPISPRMQQKKLELEKQSRPPTPPSDSNKPRRQYGKQVTESVSPGRKLRHKVSNTQHSDDQLSEISNESRSLSCQGDEISQQSDSITVDSKMDMEVTSSLQCAKIIDSQSPSLKAIEQLVSRSMHKKSILRFDEDESIAELATDGPDHPSPVSVLDGSEYTDDEPSPVKHISSSPKVAGDAEESKKTYNKDQWNHADNFSFNSTGTGEINRKKLQSIDHLVHKLRRLNSSHDESRIDYIASLCENSNPDHRYISEILLASGLLLIDLSSELLTFQNHSSGHPINPELFLVLEQTKASSLLSKEESFPGKVAYMKMNTEKFHRRLIFDAVNDILGAKLGSCPEPWLKTNGLSKKTLSAQKLLKELCFEIEKMQAKKQELSVEDEEDGLKSMLWEDVMHGSESWTDFYGEIPLVVLDVERLIFKDLVDEIVIGEAATLRIKSGSRRKLFGK